MSYDVCPDYITLQMKKNTVPWIKLKNKDFRVYGKGIDIYFHNKDISLISEFTNYGIDKIQYSKWNDYSQEPYPLYSHDDILFIVDSLKNLYPSLVSSAFSLGKTIENRDIWCFKISDYPEQKTIVYLFFLGL